MHKIVIVGGGAGGLALATRLAAKYGRRARAHQAEVILIDRRPSHIWKPLLHEVAAGSMDPHTHQLAYAAQATWHGFEFQLGYLVGADLVAKTASVGAVSDDEGREILPPRQISYDTLILTTGSVTNYFGVPGAEEHAIGLDSVDDAEWFRRRLIAACMRAQNTLQIRPTSAAVPETVIMRTSGSADTENGECCTSSTSITPVRITIVGAGATGIELSAELRATSETLVAYGLKLDPRRDVEIRIIEASPRILPSLSERVAASTALHLKKLGIQMLTGESVVSVSETGLQTKSGKFIPSDLTVWAAGIKGSAVVAAIQGLDVTRLNQVVVRETLQAKGNDDVFAIGDCASCIWHDDVRVPPRAQAAHQQASFLVKAIGRLLEGKPLRAFRYQDMGSLVTLGHYSAVGSLMGGFFSKSMLVEGFIARSFTDGSILCTSPRYTGG